MIVTDGFLNILSVTSPKNVFFVFLDFICMCKVYTLAQSQPRFIVSEEQLILQNPIL